MNDYDQYTMWNIALNAGFYDWTHFNAMAYFDGHIYLSSRHLSRIYKLDLLNKRGDIIEWSMGYDLTGNGNVNIELNDENGNYNGFTFQHGLQILDNGNIVTLDPIHEFSPISTSLCMVVNGSI